MSDYLVHFRALLGARYSEDSPFHTDLLGHRLLNSLDAYARLELYHYEKAPLSELAHNAHELLS